MHADFWLQRWQQQQIGFHQTEVNSYLRSHWKSLALAAGSTVLVPLCGKSLDMLWLLAQGYRVIGVELSPLAIDAFFHENQLTPTITKHGDFQVHQIEGLTIYCGDFFALTADVLSSVDGIFDRAALVALPAEMRVDYAAKLQQIIKPAIPMLLVAFEYDQQQMAGPPFSVTEPEVRRLYSSRSCSLLQEADILQQEPQFIARGLTVLREKVYKIGGI